MRIGVSVGQRRVGNQFDKGAIEMKKLSTVLTAVAAMALSVPAAQAAEISGNVTLTSDYPFRGVSQTSSDPAIQGGVDLGFESGLYVGTWASNVNFDGSDSSMEWDLYLGWSGEIADGIELDLQAIHFQYPGDTDLNYQEVHVGLGLGDFSVGVNYSPAYLAVSGETFFYPHAGYSMSVPGDITLDFGVGLNIAKSDDFFGEDNEYVDYSATANLPVGGINIGIGIVGTTVDDSACDRDCEARVVVSLSKDL